MSCSAVGPLHQGQGRSSSAPSATRSEKTAVLDCGVIRRPRARAKRPVVAVTATSVSNTVSPDVLVLFAQSRGGDPVFLGFRVLRGVGIDLIGAEVSADTLTGSRQEKYPCR